jgi:glutamate synthase (NADPH/NADH) large chain
MSQLGFKTFNEMIGQRQLLNLNNANDHWKANNLDLSKLITSIDVDKSFKIYNCEEQNHGLEKILDKQIISNSKMSFKNGSKSSFRMNILNTDRSVGAMISGKIAKKYGHKGLPVNTIQVQFYGSAGQSFGAWLSSGLNFRLEGDANDYVGKGLSGGMISIYPSSKSKIVPHNNIIVGNTVLYGAISGECFFSGIAGERFAVRNSGAIAIVEGCGDHGCEYMTGGVVVVLGETGRNFAAGMSGGIAYVFNPNNNFEKNCNLEMVSIDKIKNKNKYIRATYNKIKNELLDFDEERLKILITKHVKNTKSKIGEIILNNWSKSKNEFVKVVPNDFKNVLTNEKEKNKTQGNLKKVSGL